MARKRRKRKSRDRADLTVGTILMVVGLVLIAGLGGAAWWVRKASVPLDAENCPLSGPRAIHVIMIDRSDPISGQQAQRIRQYVERAKDEAAFGTRFDIYTFEGDVQNEMKPVLRVCAPGKPDQANELIENPDRIRRTYNEAFSKVLDKKVNSLLNATTRPNSPIIESLRAAAITSFGSISDRIPLRMTLISDMVQNTAAVSQYRETLDFQTLEHTMTWAMLRPDLHGADVTILYLLRPAAIRRGVPIQNRGHQNFWEQLITASGGHLVSFEPI